MRGKKFVAIKLPKLEKRRRFWAENWRKKKKRIVAAHKKENKCFVAMELPKMGGKKKGIVAMELPKIGGERERIV